jgi:hypothetical protein
LEEKIEKRWKELRKIGECRPRMIATEILNILDYYSAAIRGRRRLQDIDLKLISSSICQRKLYILFGHYSRLIWHLRGAAKRLPAFPIISALLRAV